MSGNQCQQFRPHHLRPNKCRSCFGDKSQHDPGAPSPGNNKQDRPSKDGQLAKQASIDDSSKVEPDKGELMEELKSCCRERDELNSLVNELKGQNEQLRGKLSVGGGKSTNKSDEHESIIRDLRAQLEEAQGRATEAENQREEAREELRNLEREMEEMHDNFKEDESEQFEQLKQELDVANKNCKILQIRLNKAERQYSQLEQIKSILERQLEDWTNKQTVRMAPVITGTERLDSDPSEKQLQLNGCNFIQLGNDFVKLATRDYDQLLRDLQDTTEREKDLQEQVKFSQEEAQMKGDRLQAVEAENELLLSKVNKLTLANSRLRSRSLERSDSSGGSGAMTQSSAAQDQACDLIQLNEQLKLALDMAQSEAERLRNKWQEAKTLMESRENLLKEQTARLERLSNKNQFATSRSADGESKIAGDSADRTTKFELECRQLRTRLVNSERECKQLKAELAAGGGPLGQRQSSACDPVISGPEQAKLREIVRQLRDECSALISQNKELERKVEQLSGQQALAGSSSSMETDLVDKLKRQLEVSESELARTRSRLVEIDCENSKLQRQQRRLTETIGTKGSTEQTMSSFRKVHLPAEHLRESMSRQELRQALKELETEAEELDARLKLRTMSAGEQQQVARQQGSESPDEQLRSLRRLLDQERLLSSNLKLDVSNLEQLKTELSLTVSRLEREKLAIEEETEKLHQVYRDSVQEIDELKDELREVSQRVKDLTAKNKKLTDELVKSSHDSRDQLAGSESPQSIGEARLARDLSELKVKNGFLVRELEVARENTTRQLDDLRQAHEIQQRRAIELAEIELKERHLAESQQLRDEINELRQRLATSQRQVTRHEEEANAERDRLRSMERDWRRDKSQWQQRIEQLEAQLSIEQRSNEFKAKERDSATREKERQLISVQDKYVQLERDYKRLQNKFNLLEESGESKQRSLIRDLETKKRELSELLASQQAREEEHYEQCKRFNGERSTLMETLDSLKRSYDDKLLELKSSRELLALRQEQSYKERLALQEQLDQMAEQLAKMAEHEGQSKMLSQQIQVNERQLESLRRESCQLKEERTRLRTRCEELEKRCHRYEKQELITKTSSISIGSSSNFLKNPFHLGQQKSPTQASGASSSVTAHRGDQSDEHHLASSLVDKLTSKVNDQRHLINMLRQQNEDLQMELKQTRVMQSTERIKWLMQTNQLTSRLNAAEERLAFETSIISECPRESQDKARNRLDTKRAAERQVSQEVMQQQQAQIELLSKDIKKLSQAHDLLRLHSKQLESHNSKLSHRLIDYQQRAQSLASSEVQNNELEASLLRQDQLARQNERLVRLVREEARPLIESVAKIMAAAESGAQRKSSVSSEEPKSEASGRQWPVSTQRPLQMSPPDQEAQGAPTSSRFARLLGKPKPEPKDGSNAGKGPAQVGDIPAKTKVVKKVRAKGSSLGISLSERRELKRHIEQLTVALGDLDKIAEQTCDARNQRASSSPAESRLSSQPDGPSGSAPRAASNRSHSCSQQLTADELSDAPSSTVSHRVVRWQLQPAAGCLADSGSDLEKKSADQYRRFPQSTPANYASRKPTAGVSLTDYESESSLASFEDLSRPLGRQRLASGAESDSCLGASGTGSGSASSKAPKGTKKRGLKSRLTSTLRNISRSITGLASDSENESLEFAGSGKHQRIKRATGTSAKAGAKQTGRDMGGDDADHEDEEDYCATGKSHRAGMREIRV